MNALLPLRALTLIAAPILLLALILPSGDVRAADPDSSTPSSSEDAAADASNPAAVATGADANPASEAAAGSGSRIDVTLDQTGLRARTEDGRFAFKIGGRLHADATLHLGDTPPDIPANPPTQPNAISQKPTDGVELRRARLIATATAYNDWEWVGEIDFADNETAVKDFLLAYTGFENTTISIGNQKQPYSLSLEMSSNDIPFVERSIDNEQNILLDRAIGLRVDTNGDHWFFAGGVYGDGVNAQKSPGDEGWGIVGRTVVSPVIEDDMVIHTGLRAGFRRANRADPTGQIQDETTHMSNYRVINTGEISDLDSVVFYGPEAAVAIGPVWVFGEYSRALVRRNGFRNSRLQSGHIAVAWTITGESRAANYSIGSGEFKSITPRHNFSLWNDGGSGAWEVAFRYAYLDASDGSATNPGSINGGEEQVLSTALNWYVNPNVRFMLNWNHILETNVANSAANVERNKEAKGFDVFTFRTQFNF